LQNVDISLQTLVSHRKLRIVLKNTINITRKDISIYFKPDFSRDTSDMQVFRKPVNRKKWTR